MTAEQQMLFPFTKKDEILHWAARYLKNLSERSRDREQAVIALKEKVETRKTPETPQGYLNQSELRQMAKWKDRFIPSKIDKNPPGVIEKITGEAFGLDDDWEKIKKLKEIYGVGQSIASAILHLYDEGDYPIFDPHALRSIRINKDEVEGNCSFWKEYVKLCREKAECHGVCMRTLDRALYKFSESGAASALKNISSDMLFLELSRRGYDLSSLRDDDQSTTAEILKIG